MELNLSSGRLNRSSGQITRVPEEVDPGRAVARTRIRRASPARREHFRWTRAAGYTARVRGGRQRSGHERLRLDRSDLSFQAAARVLAVGLNS